LIEQDKINAVKTRHARKLFEIPGVYSVGPGEECIEVGVYKTYRGKLSNRNDFPPEIEGVPVKVKIEE
jgi:hypothetical protein